jgi:hypothetical protein
MPKLLSPWWRLQAKAQAEVARLAPDCWIIPCVEHDDDRVVWDDECEGLGRVSWRCRYILPPTDKTVRALVPILNDAMARWQACYDLCLTSG